MAAANEFPAATGASRVTDSVVDMDTVNAPEPAPPAAPIKTTPEPAEKEPNVGNLESNAPESTATNAAPDSAKAQVTTLQSPVNEPSKPTVVTASEEPEASAADGTMEADLTDAITASSSPVAETVNTVTSPKAFVSEEQTASVTAAVDELAPAEKPESRPDTAPQKAAETDVAPALSAVSSEAASNVIIPVGKVSTAEASILADKVFATASEPPAAGPPKVEDLKAAAVPVVVKVPPPADSTPVAAAKIPTAVDVVPRKADAAAAAPVKILAAAQPSVEGIVSAAKQSSAVADQAPATVNKAPPAVVKIPSPVGKVPAAPGLANKVPAPVVKSPTAAPKPQAVIATTPAAASKTLTAVDRTSAAAGTAKMVPPLLIASTLPGIKVTKKPAGKINSIRTLFHTWRVETIACGSDAKVLT